jgi:hypothetical protein
MKPIQTLVASSAIAAALVALSPGASAFDGLCRGIAIRNDDSRTILSVQMTHIDKPDWGRDLLGNGMIEAGGWTVVTPDNDQGYCRFDLRITYVGGAQRVIHDFNACEALRVDVLQDALRITGIDGEGELVDA